MGDRAWIVGVLGAELRFETGVWDLLVNETGTSAPSFAKTLALVCLEASASPYPAPVPQSRLLRARQSSKNHLATLRSLGLVSHDGSGVTPVLDPDGVDAWVFLAGVSALEALSLDRELERVSALTESLAARWHTDAATEMVTVRRNARDAKLAEGRDRYLTRIAGGMRLGWQATLATRPLVARQLGW